jgi:acyl carrier protein
MNFVGDQTAAVTVSHSRLIAVVTALVRELRGPSTHVNVTLSSRLDRDLGIDSLGRTELVLRIEREFRIRLPIGIIGEAETVQDILTALEAVAFSQGAPDIRAVIAAESRIAAQPIVAATEAKTLVEALEWHVARDPDRVHVTVLQDESTVLANMTYAELARAARAVAAGLIARDIEPRDRVALMLPTGTEFFAAFFGTLYAGAVPVPIYPPMQLSQLEEYLRRQAKILRNAEAKVLVTVTEALRLGGLLRGLVPSLRGIESVSNLASAPTEGPLPKFRIRTPRPSFNTRREAPAIQRGSCSATRICWPTFAPFSRPSMQRRRMCFSAGFLYITTWA